VTVLSTPIFGLGSTADAARVCRSLSAATEREVSPNEDVVGVVVEALERLAQRLEAVEAK
jgi:hypothetical protein